MLNLTIIKSINVEFSSFALFADATSNSFPGDWAVDLLDPSVGPWLVFSLALTSFSFAGATGITVTTHKTNNNE